MPFFKKRAEIQRVESITAPTIELIMEASKTSLPNEFAGFLRAEKGTIEEVLLLPGTFSGDRSALLRLHMLPIDFTVVGTVHSHPSGDGFPSGADVHLFDRFGYVHIISYYPFQKTNWRAFDLQGKEIALKVVE